LQDPYLPVICTAMRLNFTKMHGLGNDFVVINGLDQRIELSPDNIRYIADRHTGVGCDQVLVLQAGNRPEADMLFRIYNADGNEVEQCGNGARCIGRYLWEKGIVEKDVITVQAGEGIIRIYKESDEAIRVNMGIPRFEPELIPVAAGAGTFRYRLDLGDEGIEVIALSMGNPHAIVFVEDVDTAEVERTGRQIQQLPVFPESVNVGFLQVLDRTAARLRVYERGVGETLACGTGACAAVVAGIVEDKLDNEVVIGLKKGNLVIRWDGGDSQVWMTGPAVTVFEGQILL